MALIIRFVDRNNVIREEFLQFIYLNSGLRGVDMKAEILHALRDCGIDVKNCRDQGYDGDGNMTGGHNGCAAKEYSLAIYFHCA